MLAMARDAGATRVDLMGAVFYFDYNQNTKATQPQPQSQPAEQATAPPPSSSSTLRELLSKPPRVRDPALGVAPGTARPVRQPMESEPQAQTQKRTAAGRPKRRTPKRRTPKAPAARPATLDDCCSAWRKKQQDKQQRRRCERAAKQADPQPQPQPKRKRRQNARQRRSAARSERCHAARRLREKLSSSILCIQWKFIGGLLRNWRKARAARVAADPVAEAARLKARAAAARAERVQAARAEREARQAAQPEPMDTSEAGSTASKRRLEETAPVAKRVPSTVACDRPPGL